jgi:hypothetical protein
VRALILTPLLKHVNTARLKDIFRDYQILVNTITEDSDVIAIVDASHEGHIPARWPERVIVVGDTLTNHKADIRLPLPRAQELLEQYLSSEITEDEPGEQDVGNL